MYIFTIYIHTHTQLLTGNLCVLGLFVALLRKILFFFFNVLQLDLVLHSAKNLSATSNELGRAVSREPYQRVASTPNYISSSLPAHGATDDNPHSEPCKAVLLPDLNMIPLEEDSGLETLYGMS